MRSSALPLVLSLALLPCPALLAQGDLQSRLKDTGVGKHWIYDDISQGFAESKASGKPLLVLFR
ncbi:MAG: hypothetical protein HYS13_20910 [Planctomycetia bacterium]|nr:hypothetical protein [Planctomycetia bacterium]